MNIKDKLKVLIEAYQIYEKFLDRFTFVCQKFCADCCTCNVTMTTLEGYYLIDRLFQKNRTGFMELLDSVPERRFYPGFTFNETVAIYAEGKEVSEQSCDPGWGRCPFLAKDQCLVYDVRPFGCRCMVSEKKCSENGFAQMDPVLLTVNTVFMQFIEHVDRVGYSGNMTDVLRWIGHEKNRQSYEHNKPEKPCQNLLTNKPIPVLMVPFNHRKKMENLLTALNNLLSIRQLCR